MTWFLQLHVRLFALSLLLLARIFPLTRLARLVTPPARIQWYRRLDVEIILAVVQAVLRNPRYMKRRACIRFGLTLYHFLRLSGREAVVHFSVAAPSVNPNRLHAHCWVSLNGEPVVDPPSDGNGFKNLWQWPSC
jgi:hypothetical protein